jgi:hypothetical protein
MRTATKVAVVGAGLTAGSMFCRSCVGSRGVVRSHRDRRWRGILGLPNVLAGNLGNCTPNPYENASAVAVPLKRYDGITNSIAKEPPLLALVVPRVTLAAS